MSDRSRRSTESGTGVSRGARPKASAEEPAAGQAPWEVPTEIKGTRRRGSSAGASAPSAPPPGAPRATSPTASPDQPTPIEVTQREASEPIRVISMKQQVATERPQSEPRAPLHVQLRSMAEVAGVHDPSSKLGRLAPPRDPRQVRARRRRADLAWAGLAILLAAVISLVIWLLAGR